MLEAIEALRFVKPLPAMSSSPLLELTALDHCRDTWINNDEESAESIQERIEKYCTWKGSIGENIVSMYDGGVCLSLSSGECIDLIALSCECLEVGMVFEIFMSKSLGTERSDDDMIDFIYANSPGTYVSACFLTAMSCNVGF